METFGRIVRWVLGIGLAIGLLLALWFGGKALLDIAVDTNARAQATATAPGAPKGTIGLVKVPTGAVTTTVSVVNTDNLDNVGVIDPTKVAVVMVDGQTIGAISTNPADPCVFYVAPGVGVEAKVEVTLYDGAAFAADADVFVIGDQTLGVKNNSADVLIFGDQPGNYAFTGSSFGLCVGQKTDNNADRQINDRRHLDSRPMFWISPEGTATDIGKDKGFR